MKAFFLAYFAFQNKQSFVEEPIKIADIYISISMGTFEHRKYKIRSEDGNK